MNNPFEHTYSPNQMVEIPGNVLLNWLHFCQQVKESQPTEAILYSYPESSVIKKDEDGNIINVKVDWKLYGAGDMKGFFSTIESPQPIATKLSVMADQFIASILEEHNKNIEKGLTKNKVENEEEDVSRILSK